MSIIKMTIIIMTINMLVMLKIVKMMSMMTTKMTMMMATVILMITNDNSDQVQVKVNNIAIATENNEVKVNNI